MQRRFRYKSRDLYFVFKVDDGRFMKQENLLIFAVCDHDSDQERKEGRTLHASTHIEGRFAPDAN